MAPRLFHELKATFWRTSDPTDPFEDVDRSSMRLGLAIAAAMAAAVVGRMAQLGLTARDVVSFALVLAVIAALVVCTPVPSSAIPLGEGEIQGGADG